MQFSLHPSIDVAALRQCYAANGWVSVTPFIDETQAEALRDHLVGRQDWTYRLRDLDGRRFDLNADEVAAWGPERLTAMRQLATPRDEQKGFGVAHSRIRLISPDAKRVETPSILADFAQFLFEPTVASTIGTIIGVEGIDFADSFAARYDPGDYTTVHDDGVDQREAAYVFGLTKPWRPEWGGLLLFHGDDGAIERGLIPAFNCLNLFKVPTAHSVSVVAPFVSSPRLTVTGWYYSDGADRHTAALADNPSVKEC